MAHIFNTDQLKKAAIIQDSQYAKFSGLMPEEIKNLAVVWCYYSGKIEGNTYSYIETETLLKDGITPVRRYEDAKMLKNLYNTFISVVETIGKKQKSLPINERSIFTIHSMLTSELLPAKNRGILRCLPVKITGTNYIPPANEEDIKASFCSIIDSQEGFDNPLERAVYLHCNVAKLQPFADGNKRTARMIESAVLLNADIIPIYSAKDEDILNYRKGLIHFYETCDYSQYTDYFLEQQLSRLQEVTPVKAKKVNISPKPKYCGMKL